MEEIPIVIHKALIINYFHAAAWAMAFLALASFLLASWLFSAPSHSANASSLEAQKR